MPRTPRPAPADADARRYRVVLGTTVPVIVREVRARIQASELVELGTRTDASVTILFLLGTLDVEATRAQVAELVAGWRFYWELEAFGVAVNRARTLADASSAQEHRRAFVRPSVARSG